MLKRTYTYQFGDLNIDSQHIENVIGYKTGESPETISEMIEEVISTTGLITGIRSEYNIYNNVDLELANGVLEVNQVKLFTRKIVISQIRKAEQVAVFLCTVGQETGDKSRTLMKEGDLLKGYIYDVVGSEVVESVADKMQEQLKGEMKDMGLGISNRFSPGYCGWDVSEQHKLFSLIPDNFCGITLTDSALMLPIKSISGIIAIGKEVVYRPYSCNRCDDERCIYRDRKR